VEYLLETENFKHLWRSGTKQMLPFLTIFFAIFLLAWHPNALEDAQFCSGGSARETFETPTPVSIQHLPLLVKKSPFTKPKHSYSWRKFCPKTVEERWKALKKWAILNGGVVKNITNTYFEMESKYNRQRIRGMKALETIYAGQLIVYIPESILISTDKVLQMHELKKYDLFKTFDRDQFGVLAFFLLHQTYNIQSSFYWPYLCMLPKTFCLPGTCNDDMIMAPYEDHEWFEDLETRVSERRTKVAHQHAFCLSKVMDRYPYQFPRTHYNKESWNWAWGLVKSRVWIGDVSPLTDNQKTFRLMPIMDLFNHHASGEMLVQIHTALRPGNNHKHWDICPTWSCQVTDRKYAYKVGDTCRDRRYDAEKFVCCDEKTQKCKDTPCWVAGSQCKNKKPSGQALFNGAYTKSGKQLYDNYGTNKKEIDWLLNYGFVP